MACIFGAYLLWLFSGRVPCFFNVSFLWLLPKMSPINGIFNPRDTRTLSGSNTDHKIFAMALGACFNRVLNEKGYSNSVRVHTRSSDAS